MALKLILVSVQGTIVNPKGVVEFGVAKEIAELARELEPHGVRIALWSNQAWTCGGVPLYEYIAKIAGVAIYAHGVMWDGSPARKRGGSASGILEKHGVRRHETILLGGGVEDMVCGVNNRLLHIRSDWYGQQADHGFQVKSVSEFRRFCLLFGLRADNLFWSLRDGGLNVATAGPFSTIIEAYKKFGYDARNAAKYGAGHPDFWFYVAVASIYFSGLLEDVDMICSYPGHSGMASTIGADSLESILARLGRCTRSPYFHDLLVRHSPAQKSQPIKAVDRLFLTQLNTIHLNRRPRQNLAVAPRKTRLICGGKKF